MSRFKHIFYAIAMVTSFIMMGVTQPVSAGQIDEYQFRVFLDGDEIGTHRVQLKQQGDQKEVSIEANFDVKILFVNVYSYRHSNSETWTGQCLNNINARTDANGDDFFVVSRDSSQGLKLGTHDGEKQLEGCVRTFAYWDPGLLRAERLLNTQTGEYVAASINEIGAEAIELNGTKVMANRYQLIADNEVIDLWYADGNRWVALESKTEKGRTIRYESTEELVNVSASI
jgi:hypothetical protein